MAQIDKIITADGRILRSRDELHQLERNYVVINADKKNPFEGLSAAEAAALESYIGGKEADMQVRREMGPTPPFAVHNRGIQRAAPFHLRADGTMAPHDDVVARSQAWNGATIMPRAYSLAENDALQKLGLRIRRNGDVCLLESLTFFHKEGWGRPHKLIKHIEMFHGNHLQIDLVWLFTHDKVFEPFDVFVIMHGLAE